MRKGTKIGVATTTSSVGNYNSCTYYCDPNNHWWYLLDDNSEPGYWCPNEAGACDPENDDTMTTDAPEIESSLARTSLSSAGAALPKNSAIYAYDRAKKVLRRMRGKWSKGMTSPHEYSIPALMKVNQALGNLAASLAKNKSVGSFEIIVPAQKLAPQKNLAKKKSTFPPKKSVVKKSTLKTTNRRSS